MADLEIFGIQQQPVAAADNGALGSAEEDPAADFLAKQENEIAGIENDEGYSILESGEVPTALQAPEDRDSGTCGGTVGPAPCPSPWQRSPVEGDTVPGWWGRGERDPGLTGLHGFPFLEALWPGGGQALASAFCPGHMLPVSMAWLTGDGPRIRSGLWRNDVLVVLCVFCLV